MSPSVTEEIAARIRANLRAKWPDLGIEVGVDEATYVENGIVAFRAGFVGVSIGGVPWALIDQATRLPERLGDELAASMDVAFEKFLSGALANRATL